MTKKLPIVEVEWLDACVDGGWNPRATYVEKAKLVECRTAGYLLKSGKQHIIIVQSQDDQGKVTDSMTIPRSSITSLKRLV